MLRRFLIVSLKALLLVLLLVGACLPLASLYLLEPRIAKVTAIEFPVVDVEKTVAKFENALPQALDDAISNQLVHVEKLRARQPDQGSPGLPRSPGDWDKYIAQIDPGFGNHVYVDTLEEAESRLASFVNARESGDIGRMIASLPDYTVERTFNDAVVTSPRTVTARFHLENPLYVKQETYTGTLTLTLNNNGANPSGNIQVMDVGANVFLPHPNSVSAVVDGPEKVSLKPDDPDNITWAFAVSSPVTTSMVVTVRQYFMHAELLRNPRLGILSVERVIEEDRWWKKWWLHLEPVIKFFQENPFLAWACAILFVLLICFVFGWEKTRSFRAFLFAILSFNWPRNDRAQAAAPEKPATPDPIETPEVVEEPQPPAPPGRNDLTQEDETRKDSEAAQAQDEDNRK